MIASAVGLLALLSLVVVPASPMDLLVLSVGVLAAVAGATRLRAPLLLLPAGRTAPSRRRHRTVPLLQGRVTDTKRSPLAPRAPGLV